MSFERIVMKLTLIVLLTIAVMSASAHLLRSETPAVAVADTVALIKQALADAKSQEEDERLSTLQAAAKRVLEVQPNNLLISTKLQAALDQSEADTKSQAKSLQTALSESAEILNFRMKKEADLPKGFPEPGSLGEIHLKQYPAYRLARAASKADSAFFTLFNHIKANKIEMTAPVEMRFDNADQKYQQIDMAFLYGEPDWGKLGDAGKGVTVQDIPEMTTVAIGLTGDFDPKSATYIDALEAWLARHAPEYERDGKVRVMGYNSPFVWKSQRFFEIEIPVKKRAASAEIAKP
jgi:hypothetical protein